jgi:hypothetical protein
MHPLLTKASFAVVQAKIKASDASAFFPSGQWGNFRSLRHVHIRLRGTIVDRSVRRSCASESKQARQQFSHRGDGNFARSLRHAPPPVVDRSVGRSCASENQSKRVSISHRGHGNFSRSLRHAQSVVDQSVGCSCASESRGKQVSNFPMGPWEILSVSTHIVSCVPADGAR